MINALLFVAELQFLKKRIKKSRQSAYAKGTFSNLRTQIRAYLLFCDHFGLDPFPANTEVLAYYIQFLALNFRAHGSILNYISGLRFAHVLLGYEFPDIRVPELRLLLRGIARLSLHVVRQAKPVDAALLLRWSRLVDWSCPRSVTMWCISLFAFFLMARKSNLVFSPGAQVDPRMIICRGDIKRSRSGLTVTFRKTKTRQFGGKGLRVPLVPHPNKMLCPVTAFLRMVAMIPAPPPAVAFISLPLLRPVTYAEWSEYVRSSVGQLGENPTLFSSHSFRRGGASHAFRSGVPPELIQLHGGWTSDAFRRYIDFSLVQRTSVSQAMVRSLGSGSLLG